jgi:hypothetical protein
VVKAVVPGTLQTVVLDHQTIHGENFKYAFAAPLDRPSMIAQLELDKCRIRLSSKKDALQEDCIISSTGIYLNKENVLSLQLEEAQISKEKLFLGSFRSFDVDRSGRNCDLEQLFPAWFNLGQIDHGGTIIDQNQICDFYLDSIEGLFSPKIPSALHSGYLSIRSYFFQQEGNLLTFLPKISEKFLSGLMRVHANDLTITFEWSKKELKRIVMQAHRDGEWQIKSGQKFRTMRRRADYKTQQGRHIDFNAISLKKGEYAFFDQFR